MVINDAAVAAFWKTCCGDHAIAEERVPPCGTVLRPRAGALPGDAAAVWSGTGTKRATARVDMEFEKYGIPRRVPGDHWLVTDTVW